MCRKPSVARRLFLVGILVLEWHALTVYPSAAAATLTVELFPKTGEIRLRNSDVFAPVPIIFYSIKSSSGALNGAASIWKSITENYDAPFGSSPGNGFVDPNGEWIKISATSTELAEGALGVDGGRILEQRSVSLGRIWNPNLSPFPDLIFTATALDGQPIDVSPVFAVDGDYLPDGVVNQFDYALWRQFYGSSNVLLADGNLNGVVDTADYVLWRDNLGMRLLRLAAATQSPSPTLTIRAAIPEPAAAVLVLGLLAGMGSRGGRCLSRRSRPKRQRRAHAAGVCKPR